VSLPRHLLRLEGLALFVGSLIVYFYQGYGWVLLVVLFLAPDISFAGYLAGPRAGALSYNALHTTVGPIALVIVGVLSDTDWCVQVALIWLGAHRPRPAARLRLEVPDGVQGHSPEPRVGG
jgi:Domain of unknown function (DUF4260)